MKKLLFIFLISLNIIWANSHTYWSVQPYPIDPDLSLDKRVELKYKKQNGVQYISEITVYGLTKYRVRITNKWAIVSQSRKSKIWIKESEFNLEKEIDKFEPRAIKKAYTRLLKTLKKRKIELEPYEFYNLVYEVGIHDKTVREINDLAYYYAKKHPASKLLIKVYRDILSLYPKRAVAYYNLGDAYWALGQKENALEAYNRYITLMRREKKEHKIPPKILKLTHQKRVASYIDKDEKFLKIEYGDLNRDTIEDAILVTEKKNGNRPLYILLGTEKGGYRVYGKNENIVYRAEAGGARGDPFYGITIKNGYFSIEHEGGSRWMWTDIITFRYDSKKRKFFLHKEGGSEADTRSDNGVVEFVNRKVKTVKDFGIVPFEKYR